MLARKIIVGMALLVCTAIVVPVWAETYYVDPNGSNDANGLSWATAFETIQKGIDTSNDSDTVEVNEGTYCESVNFGGKDITVHGAGPTATIIDSSGEPNVVMFGTDSGATLSGFTVTGGTRGVYCAEGSQPVVSNCIVRNNSGEGIYAELSTVTIKNSIIYDNNEGITLQDVEGTIRNNTIVNNTSYGVRVSEGNEPTISNCILWNNGGDLSGCSVTYSCIKNGDSGTGNIGSYPYFEDYDGNNFHLTWNSPCINRGDPNSAYTGESDIDGENRVADEEYVIACVDMGADELNIHNINLVQNPGFEDGTDANGTPLHWLKYQVYSSLVDSNEKHSGNYSWKLTNNGTQYSGAHSDFIKIENENAYEFSVWVRTEGEAPFLSVRWEEFNGDQNPLGTIFSIFSGTRSTTGWTQFSGKHRIYDKNMEYVRILFFGPYMTSGSVWWDDFSLKNLGTAYLPAYGCVNEPNIAASVKFGSNGLNEDWIKGTITAYMSDPCVDSNDENITYRELKAGKTIEIEFPAWDADSNGLPNSPMLLEIMFKDTVGDECNNADVSEDRIKVSSKIDWIYQDPCYLAGDTNRYCPLISFGGFADGRWKYIQYGFQKSDFQYLRAVNGKYTIKIENLTDNYGASYNVPIDYVCLRKITDSEWQSLYERQRDLRFKKVELADKCDNCNYDDPNLVIFCRDFMHPVYKDTRPAGNEPNSISTFSTWNEVEPVSFSIYSEGGVDDLTISVSNLTNINDSNSVIDGNNIFTWRVVHDEARLGYFVWKETYATDMGYASVPDRLEKLSGTLSVAAGTSQSVWLKINVPAKSANLSAGDYKGQIYIQKPGVYDKTIDVTLTVYDITLEAPTHLNYVYHDPYRYYKDIYVTYSDDIGKTFASYAETRFDAYYGSSGITISRDMNQPYNFGIDANLFESRLDRMIAEGFAKHKVNLASGLLYDSIYYYSTGKSFGGTNIWAQLSEPDFCYAFGRLIDKYCEIGQSKDRDIEFIFHVADEPGSRANVRIICDRLYTIMKDPIYVNDINHVHTGVTYYSACDNECSPGDYNVPTADGNIPPLTNLVDYKIWELTSYEGTGYDRHRDANYHGYLGYYTTAVSYYRNPVYNRFLHGLFAYTTDACSVGCYAMGDYVGDPYNDFDSGWKCIWPFSYPDFLLAYPTWSGEIYHTIGGLEAIREGIKDGRYFATLQKLIADNPTITAAQVAQEYLDDLKDRVNPHYGAYYSQRTGVGHYAAILKEISEANDPNDYEVFTRIRKKLAQFTELLMTADSNNLVWNKTQDKFYITIQNGVDNANDNDEIIVYPGTYYESVSFSDKDIMVHSTDPNDWDVVAETIIDANGANNSVVFDSGEGNSSVLTGLTIKGAVNGIDCNSSSPTISKCVIRDNSSAGVYCVSGSPAILNNKIYSNGSYGINLSQTGSSTIVKNNLIYDDAKGIYLDNPQGAATISNNTIVDNAAEGICKSSGTAPTITNCIVWNNSDDLYDCNATYSCIENNDVGTGNISSDPCFVNADGNDFHIDIHSPCIDAGNPNGSYTGQTDIDGGSRVVGTYVDMGADESIVPKAAHYWMLDETSGTTADDSIDNNDGTFDGNNPCWVAGLIGGAIDCNGVSDYFSVSSMNTAYNPASTFTVAGWFKTSQSTGMQTIVGQWGQYKPNQYAPSLYFGWQVLVENKKVVARFGSSSISDITGTSDVNNGNWHHFALVYPTVTSNAVLYVDGSSQGTPGTKTCAVSNTKFRIGDGSYVSSGSPVLKGGPFKGMIDDVMIFNSVLSANAVNQLYLSGQ